MPRPASPALEAIGRTSACRKRSLAYLALAGCAGADATTLTTTHPSPPAAHVATNDVGLVPGESMAFEVRLGGVLAGEAALAVGQIGDVDGHRAVVVRSRAATAGAAALIKRVVDESITTIDLATGRPILLDTEVQIGEQRTRAHARFTPTAADVTYTTKNDKTSSYSIDFGRSIVHDAHSAMAQLRGWKGTRGQTRTVFVVGGRRLWRIDLTYAGEETIGSTVGNRRAVRYDGASYRATPRLGVEAGRPARTFTVWLSDDGDRVPLKLVAKTELGDITLSLTEYSRS
jgi:hypothetical protein